MNDRTRALATAALPDHPALRQLCHEAIGRSLLQRRPVAITARVARFGRRWGWFAVDVTEDPAGQYPPAIVAEHGRAFTHCAAQRLAERALAGYVDAYGGLWYARAGTFFTLAAVGCAACGIATFAAAVWQALGHYDADAFRDAVAFVLSVAGAAGAVLADEWLRADGAR